MGMPYALIKRDKPEAFNLGKGSILAGWPKVFGRTYGIPFGVGKSNFEEPLDPTPTTTLTRLIIDYDHGYTGDASEVAERIAKWVGDDVCFLINYWEDIEGMLEDDDGAEAVDAEFNDLRPQLCAPLSKYVQTGDVWS